ncbi:guanine nucleotide exchange factor MSS4-like [Paramacrobiotus metropolitanus]|uniref:guanine nucleotide exchange factor MSS4-like n=1 Tax=Paramacrobiotus metropolitanus TaxID=2943436 RepID=UPI002445CFA2|nr:guanine nucleotide exchange factor MSS4-like [Paramacrobiotus metropolitanus]
MSDGEPAGVGGGNADANAVEPAAAQNDTVAPAETNPKTLVCERCGSKILLPNCATSVCKKVFLPAMSFKARSDATAGAAAAEPPAFPADVEHVVAGVAGEALEAFWLVKGMYTFENVGVSHSVQHVKYLTCADCEMGPIGYHAVNGSRDDFFIAKSRVKET